MESSNSPPIAADVCSLSPARGSIGIDIAPAIVVVEGINDIEFLTRLSVRLHQDNPTIYSLAAGQARGELIFVPFGGGDVSLWTHRLAPLGVAEFHLYDREIPPETERRQRMVELINARAGCCALLTRKRSLENYLHPRAITLSGGPELAFSDGDSVPDLLARTWFERSGPDLSWNDLARRGQKRLCNRAKRWLNIRAIEQMTYPLLAERDPAGEVMTWISIIAELAGRRS